VHERLVMPWLSYFGLGRLDRHRLGAVAHHARRTVVDLVVRGRPPL